MKRVALYARVSTLNQENEQTINNQLMAIKERIVKDGNLLIENCIYQDDGWSGGVLERPALDRARQDAKDGLFEVLYVYDRSRLARKLAYQEIVIEELQCRDIEFVTIQDSDDPLLQAIQGVFYEFERTKIYERFRLGKIRKTQDGKLLGYNPLYGYDYVPRTKTANGYFVINEAEAEVVRKIFHWVADEGFSTLKVIRKLYEEGIPPRKGKRDTWTRGPISRMLRETSYFGEHYYLKTEAIISKSPKTANKYHRVKKNGRRVRPLEDRIKIEIPAIIDKDIFQRANEQLAHNAKFASRNRKNNYLLSGLIYCTCGKKRIGEKSAEHLYYRCTDRIYSYPLPYKCKEKGISAKILDELVYSKVVQLFDNKALVKKQAKRWLESRKGSYTASQGQISRLKEHQSKLQAEEERYLKAYGSNLLSFNVYEKQMTDLNMRKSRLQNEINKVESNVDSDQSRPASDPETIYSKAIETIKKFNLEDKQVFVQKVISQIIANQTEALVKGYLPLVFEETGAQNGSFRIEDRHRWTSKCRKEHIV